MAAFHFHYNKPASLKAGHPIMTVHTGGQCIMVREIVCKVPVATRERRTQPRMVIAGQGVVRITGTMEGRAVATITAD
jgi:hypothetical protein